MQNRSGARRAGAKPARIHILRASLLALLLLATLSWGISPRAAAQVDDELAERARAAVLTGEDLGPSWTLLVENAGNVVDPVAAHFTSVYGDDRAGPQSSGVLAAGSAAFIAATPMPSGFADSFRPGFFAGFGSTSGVGADAFAEVDGPAVNGTSARWYVAEVDDPALAFHVVFLENPASIGVVFGAGNQGRISQADVVPLAQTVADRLR